MKFLLVLGIVLMVVSYLAMRLDIFPRTHLQKAIGGFSDGDVIMAVVFLAGLFCVIVSALWWGLT
jgi:hypothetical protein